MKAEKKLVRGLAEISPLFRDVVKTEKIKHLVSVEPPVAPELVSLEGSTNKFICVAPMVAQNDFEVQDEIDLANVLSRDFRHSYFITVNPSFDRYEKYGEFFDIPSWEKLVVNDQDYSVPASDCVTFTYFPRSKFDSLMVLKPLSEAGEKKLKGPTMAFIDGGFVKTPELKEKVLNLLDFAVLVFTPSVASMTQAYYFMRESFALNRKLRFLALIVGDGAENACDFIYERFNDIVARFVGCDVGLLGWAEGGRSYVDFSLMMGNDLRPEVATSSKFLLQRELCGTTYENL